ncbi:MAG: hypothetical protein V1766_06015 [Pseudomonadota bacterium]
MEMAKALDVMGAAWKVEYRAFAESIDQKIRTARPMRILISDSMPGASR